MLTNAQPITYFVTVPQQGLYGLRLNVQLTPHAHHSI